MSPCLLLLCMPLAILGLSIEQDTLQQLTAGITTEFHFLLNFVNDSSVQDGATLDIVANIRSSGTGCVPTFDVNGACNSTSDDFEFLNVLVVDKRNVTLTIISALPLDFSLVGQVLLAHVLVVNPPRPAGYTRISAAIQGAAPIVLESLNAVVVGQSDMQLILNGTGFSRYVDQLQNIEIRAFMEADGLLKPTVQPVSSTETSVVLRVSTSCVGTDISTVDASLVGNQLQLTNLMIGGSNLTLQDSVLISDVIIASAPFAITEVTPLATFTDGLVTLTGQTFSCNAQLMELAWTLDNDVAFTPPMGTIRVLSPTQVEIQVMSCNGTLNGLDYSLSGSTLQASVIIGSAFPQTSASVDLSVALRAETPTISTPPIALVAGQNMTDAILLQGTWLSCELNAYTIDLQSSSRLGALPIPSIVSATREQVALQLLSCEGALTGIDVSLDGSQLLYQLTIVSRDMLQTPMAALNTGNISAIAPSIDVSGLQLMTGDISKTVSVPSTGLSCSSEFNTVVVVGPSEYELPRVTILSINQTFAQFRFLSCGSADGIDASLVGSILQLRIAVASFGAQQVDVFDAGGPIAVGVIPTITSIEPLTAGFNAESVVTGRGFSCNPTFNAIRFQLEDPLLLLPPPTANVTTAGPEALGLAVDMDFSLINAALSAQVDISAVANLSSTLTSVGSVVGLNPSVVPIGRPIELCSNEEDSTNSSTTFEIQVIGVPRDKAFLQVTLFALTKEISGTTLESIIVNSTGTFLALGVPDISTFEESADPNSLAMQMVVTTSELSSARTPIGIIGVCSSSTGSGQGGGSGIDQDNDGSAGLRGGAIAAIVIASLALVGFVVEVVYLNKRRKQETNNTTAALTFEEVVTPPSMTPKERITTI